MENPRAFSKYILPNLLVLWLDAFWLRIIGCWIPLQTFCSLPLYGSQVPGLQLMTTLKDSFIPVSFKSGHNRQGTSFSRIPSISGGACSSLHALLVATWMMGAGSLQDQCESNTTRETFSLLISQCMHSNCSWVRSLGPYRMLSDTKQSPVTFKQSKFKSFFLESRSYCDLQDA